MTPRSLTILALVENEKWLAISSNDSRNGVHYIHLDAVTSFQLNKEFGKDILHITCDGDRFTFDEHVKEIHQILLNCVIRDGFIQI